MRLCRSVAGSSGSCTKSPKIEAPVGNRPHTLRHCVRSIGAATGSVSDSQVSNTEGHVTISEFREMWRLEKMTHYNHILPVCMCFEDAALTVYTTVWLLN